MNMNARSQKNGSWRPFISLLKQTRLPIGMITAVFAVNMALTTLGLLFPSATEQILAGNISNQIVWSAIAILLGQALVTALRQFLAGVAMARTTLSFRKTMLRKVLRLPVPYYDKNMADQMISRTTNDTATLSEFIASGIPYIPAAIYSFVAAFIILFGYNWRLVVLEMFIVPVVLLITILYGKVQFSWNRNIQGKIAVLTGYLAEALQNVPLIKVFVREKYEEEKGKKNIEQLYRTRRNYSFAIGGIAVLSGAEGLIQTLLAVIGGAFLVSKGYITLSVWVAFYLYSNNLVGAMESLFDYWQRLKAIQGAASRISEISEETEENCREGISAPEEIGDIVFDKVSFRYDKDLILKNVSFRIPSNCQTVFVGRSGAGKSTVFGLIERFYQPLDGIISVGGKDISEYNLHSWRQSIGYVQQNGKLFSGTIRENMCYGLEREVGDKELREAAEQACIYEFITSLPQGFDTQVGEGGSRLSGGEQQRINIAAALLKNPKILLLDEVTSSLDAESAAFVEQAMRRLKKGRTVITITHDISGACVREADHIIVFDEGEVSGAGTDEELSNTSEVYSTLKDSANYGFSE